MKVLVPTKRVIDPYVTVHVKKDGSGVETQNVKMAMNPFDEIALEEAIRWKEQNKISQILCASIGDQQTQETLRHALALGADEAILLTTEQTYYPLHIAKILKWVAEREKVDLIIMGKQAIDDDANQTGQMLAALLNWPQATFASQIAFVGEKQLRVTREIDGGLETLKVDLPCVVTTDLRLNEPRYPALPNIMKAKRKPLQIIPVEETGLTLHSQVERLTVTPPPTRKSGRMVNSVAELVQALHTEAKVI